MNYQLDDGQADGVWAKGSGDSEPLNGRSTFIVLLGWAGTLASIALVAGFGYWAVGIIDRDRSGIPVIRAMEGSARTKPAEPGGAQAKNRGLSVNSVLETGAASEPATTVVLAPRPMPLDPEDIPSTELASLAGAGETDQAATTATGDAASLSGETLPATASGAPTDVADPSGDFVAAAIAADQQAASDVTADPFLLPRPRPRGLGATTPAPQTAVLVQLGSFASKEAAERWWETLVEENADLMADRQMLVEETEHEGRPTYRLHANGFADQAETRDICTELLERGAHCIPVMIR